MIKVYYMDAADLSDAVLEKIYNEASPFRRQKSDAFKALGARRLSLCASALLAEGLKEYGLAESELDYELLEHGKPAIKGHPEIHFSISHSVDKVMVCFAESQVGCDIEKCESETADKESADLKEEGTSKVALAKRFFHSNEAKAIEENPELFYRFWTLKESFVKQSGKGLSTKLKDFEVVLNLNAESSSSSLTSLMPYARGSELYLAELESFKGYCAAICVEEKEEVEITYIWRQDDRL